MLSERERNEEEARPERKNRSSRQAGGVVKMRRFCACCILAVSAAGGVQALRDNVPAEACFAAPVRATRARASHSHLCPPAVLRPGRRSLCATAQDGDSAPYHAASAPRESKARIAKIQSYLDVFAQNPSSKTGSHWVANGDVIKMNVRKVAAGDAEVRVGEPVAGGYHVQDRLEKAARYASIFQDRTMSGDERLDAVRSEDQNYQQEQP